MPASLGLRLSLAAAAAAAPLAHGQERTPQRCGIPAPAAVPARTARAASGNCGSRAMAAPAPAPERRPAAHLRAAAAARRLAAMRPAAARRPRPPPRPPLQTRTPPQAPQSAQRWFLSSHTRCGLWGSSRGPPAWWATASHRSTSACSSAVAPAARRCRRGGRGGGGWRVAGAARLRSVGRGVARAAHCCLPTAGKAEWIGASKGWRPAGKIIGCG
jgi:hypothetical protein